MQKNPTRALRCAVKVTHGLGLHPMARTEHPHVTQLEESLFCYWLWFPVPSQSPGNHSSPSWNWHFFYCLQIRFLFLSFCDHRLVAVSSLAALSAISCASLLYSALQRKVIPSPFTTLTISIPTLPNILPCSLATPKLCYFKY